MPDPKLLESAQAQQLAHGDNLQLQANRMLQDDRIGALAREFFGQWLRYRDYLEKDPINAEAFPGYTDELRQAMWHEPIELGEYLIRNDLPITTLISSAVSYTHLTLPTKA